MFLTGYLDIDYKVLFVPLDVPRAENPTYQFVSGLVARDKERRNIESHRQYRYPYDDSGVLIKVTNRTKFYRLRRGERIEITREDATMHSVVVTFTPWFLNTDTSVGMVLFATNIEIRD